ncbi:MAG TPA: dephospho-CoA kinase [Nevskiaceae bacterium]
MNAWCVGLTGGIASGKTRVASCFHELGVPVLDADSVAREVVAPGSPALLAIADRLGTRFVRADGTLDRRALRDHVFADPAARKRLEAITHPAIHERVRAWRAAQAAPYCIYSIALMLRTNTRREVDRVLVVDAPVEIQLQRLMSRDRQTEAQARRVVEAQVSRAERLAIADDIIDNRGGEARIAPQVRRLHRLYTSLAGSAGSCVDER